MGTLFLLDCLLIGLKDSSGCRTRRLVLPLGRRHLTTTSSASILKSFHWLPISSRIVFKIATITYRCLNGFVPMYLTKFLSRRRSPYGLQSSESFDLYVSKTRLKSFGDRAFESMAPKIWNSLPLFAKPSQSLTNFCSSLKTHLFNSAYV